MNNNEKQSAESSSKFYEVERSCFHVERPGFRIIELEISPSQNIPWHTHTNIQDTFYVLKGELRIFLKDPEEEMRLNAGETLTVRVQRPHFVTNAGDTASATFLVLQGMGEYDFVPLKKS